MSPKHPIKRNDLKLAKVRHYPIGHLVLEYIRYPIGIAFKHLRDDLEVADTSKELRIIRNRWALAELKFIRDMKDIPDQFHEVGSADRLGEYEQYIMSARNLLERKDHSMTIWEG